MYYLCGYLYKVNIPFYYNPTMAYWAYKWTRNKYGEVVLILHFFSFDEVDKQRYSLGG